MAPIRHPDEYRTFCGRLRAARVASGLTQEQVARALGVSQSTVSKIERSERRVDILEVRELARLYDVTFDELLGE